MDAKQGTEFVIRELFLPHLRDSYADLTAAAAGADLLLTHPLTYAGPLVAQQTVIRWASGRCAKNPSLVSQFGSVRG